MKIIVTKIFTDDGEFEKKIELVPEEIGRTEDTLDPEEDLTEDICECMTETLSLIHI